MGTRTSRSRLFVRGLNSSVSGNSHAFGFSITITVTYGVLSSASGNPTLPEVFGFALAAVAAFSLLNTIVAVLLLKREPGNEPPRHVVLVATATDFFAVGAAIAAAVGIREILAGWGAWVLGPFCAGLVYVLIQAVELSVGQRPTETGSDRRTSSSREPNAGPCPAPSGLASNSGARLTHPKSRAKSSGLPRRPRK